MAQKPEWHEEDFPSQSLVNEGVSSPMAFAQRKRVEKTFSVAELFTGVKAGDRTAIGKAITLIESAKSEHRILAQELLEKLYPLAGKSLRVGITGVPGVGKSTFIEAFGSRLCDKGAKLAVLTIDPSSELTGGSILGDKTRMENLSRHANAFIRPSPSRCILGGVARWTREAIVVLEAAGYDTVFIETVGVGQSETLLKSMVDVFVLLALAGAGDELQGIKKGIMELSDLIAITKADGDNAPKAEAAKAQLERVVAYLPKSVSGWEPKVYATSAFAKVGLDELWGGVKEFESLCKKTGVFEARREGQREQWLLAQLVDGLGEALKEHPEKAAWLKAAHEKLPTTLAAEILKKLAKGW